MGGSLSVTRETFSRTRLPIDDERITLHRPSEETDRVFTPSENINGLSSSLHQIPYEIVAVILNFLSPISLAALRKTCRTFYYDYEATNQVKLDGGEWFALLCLLEHDASSMFACIECRTLHHTADFFPMDLQNSPFVRRCKRTNPLLRVCPYLNLSFKDVQEIRMNWITLEPQMLSTYDTCWAWVSLEPANPEHPHASKFIMTTLTLLSVYANGYLPPSEAINRILGECDVFLCPHKQLMDPDILALYGCWAKQGTGQHPDEYCVRCQHCVCGICGTQFRFVSGPILNTRMRYIYLETLRSLVNHDDVNDPGWLSQLSVVKSPAIHHLWSLKIMDRLLGCAAELRRFPRLPAEAGFSNEIMQRATEIGASATDIAFQRYKIFAAELGSREYDQLRMSTLSKPLWRKPGADWPEQWQGYDESSNLLLSDKF